MKILVALLCLLLATSASAQALRAGAVVGGGRHGWHGHLHDAFFYRSGFHRHGHGYAHGWYPGYRYWPTVVYTTGPAYYADSGYYGARDSYAANGLLLGSLAGAIIGNNSGDLHHNGWAGAALGASVGLVLGSIADNHVRQREIADARVVSAPTADSDVVVSADPAPSSAPLAPRAPTAPAAPLAPASPMAAANRLFGR